MSTHRRNRLLVHAIDPACLDDVRAAGADGHGNQVRPFAATGQGEPLRCCLRYAEPGEQITLLSYAPFEHPSVWREVGPVYIHAAQCAGYTPTGRLPEQLATGPSVLRAYRADDTMNYEHNTVVNDVRRGSPIAEPARRRPVRRRRQTGPARRVSVERPSRANSRSNRRTASMPGRRRRDGTVRNEL
jgi:hypothetical protein